jgi:hypothetical protein
MARDLALACVERLATLGDYEYNWSPGESHTLAHARWLDEDEVRRFIETLPEQTGSGDVYARLRAT